MRTRIVIISSLISGIFFLPVATLAATVGVSGPAQVQVGRSFQMKLLIRDAQEADTTRFIGTYPSDLLELQGVSHGNELSIRSPGSSSGGGAFNLGAFTLSDPVNGTTEVMTLTFRAKATGEALIALESGTRVLSAGEDQLTGLASARVSIVSTPAPGEISKTPPLDTTIDLSSPTHPDEDAWYPSNELVLTWDISGQTPQAVFVGFDQAPEGPAEERREASGQAIFQAPHDGVWYGHLVIRFSENDVVRKDFRFQVDGAPPRPFAIAVDHTEVVVGTPNSLRFTALDETSGIREYEIWIDEKFVTSTRENSFELDALESGEHHARIRALDWAGNSDESEVNFKLLPDPGAQKASLLQSLLENKVILRFVFAFFALVIFMLGWWIGRFWVTKRRNKKTSKKV